MELPIAEAEDRIRQWERVVENHARLDVQELWKLRCEFRDRARAAFSSDEEFDWYLRKRIERAK